MEHTVPSVKQIQNKQQNSKNGVRGEQLQRLFDSHMQCYTIHSPIFAQLPFSLNTRSWAACCHHIQEWVLLFKMANISFQARDWSLRGNKGKKHQALSPNLHPPQPEDGSSTQLSTWQEKLWSLGALVPAQCFPLQNVLCNGIQGPHFSHIRHLNRVLRGRERRSHGNIWISAQKMTGYFLQVTQKGKRQSVMKTHHFPHSVSSSQNTCWCHPDQRWGRNRTKNSTEDRKKQHLQKPSADLWSSSLFIPQAFQKPHSSVPQVKGNYIRTRPSKCHQSALRSPKATEA